MIAWMVASGMASCSDREADAPVLAAAVCDCFRPLAGTVSPQAALFLEKVSLSHHPEAAMDQEMAKLDNEARQSIARGLSALQGLNDSTSSFQQCMRSLQAKYKTAFNTADKALLEAVTAALQEKPDCRLAASMMRLGFLSGPSRSGKRPAF